MSWGFNWDHAILNFRAAPLSEAGRMEIVWSVCTSKSYFHSDTPWTR